MPIQSGSPRSFFAPALLAALLAARTLAAQPAPGEAKPVEPPPVQAVEPAKNPLDAELDRLIAALASESFAVRQQAMNEIWRLPQLSVESLRQSALRADAETAERLERLIAVMESGITPSTPGDVAGLVRVFYSGDEDVQFAVIDQLAEKDEYLLALNLIESMADEYTREWLIAALSGNYETIVARASAASGALDEARLRKIDEFMRHPCLLDAMPDDCLVYWSLRDPTWIPGATGEHSGGELGDRQRVQRIRFLGFARHHEEALAEVAKLAGSHPLKDSLRQQILRRAGRWEELAKDYEALRVAGSSAVSARCAQALLASWSGDRRQFDQAVAELQRDPSQASRDALALVRISERDLPQLLDEAQQYSPALAFRLLSRIDRYEEAFDAVGAPSELADRRSWFRRQLRAMSRKLSVARDRDDDQSLVEAEDLFALLNAVAWQSGSLGMIEESKWYYEQLAPRLRMERDYNAAHRCQEAFRNVLSLPFGEDVWHFLEQFGLHEDPETALVLICPEARDEAIAWDRILADIITDPLERMQLIASLLQSEAGKADAPFDIDLLGDVARKYIALQLPAERAELLRCVGLTFAWRERERGEAWLIEAGYEGSTEAFVNLADLAVIRDDWQAARSWSQRALQSDQHHVASRYRIAASEFRSGDAVAARQMIHHAGLLELHSWNLPWHAAIVEEAGMTEDAADMLDRWCQGVDADLMAVPGERVSDIARLAELRSDPDAALLQWRLALLSRAGPVMTVLSEHMHWLAIETALAEADCALAAGDLERTGEILLGCVEINSPTARLLERFLDRLEKAGHQQLADAIFQRTAERFRAVIERWPDSALHHNNFAWACARSNRLPEERLKHARRAVELKPGNAGYLDTLAEVMFLADDTAEATRLARQCVERHPRNEHYREQLQRFTADQ